MIKNLVNDTQTVEPPKGNGSSITDFLSSYTQDMTVLPNVNTNQSVNNPGLSRSLENTIKEVKNNNWLGDPRYYQTGKKAGELKKSSVGNTQVKPSVMPQSGQPLPNVPANQPGGGIQNTLITGSLFLLVVDLVIPFTIAAVNNWFSKDKIDSSKLGLTDKQKKDLEPLCNEVVKYLNLNANPLVIFIVSYGAICVMNYMLQKSLAKLEKKNKKPEGNEDPKY